MIYFLILIYFLFVAFVFDRVDKKKSNIIYFSQFVTLVLLLTFRFRVGGDSLFYEDSYRYLYTFQKLKKVDIFNQLYQPLWYVINAFTKSISKEFILFQFVHGLIVNSVIFYVINRFCEKRFIGLLLYYVLFFIYFNTEILRESLAIAIFLISFPYLTKKKYIHYFVLCFIAFMFHAFALFTFFVPLFFFLLRKPLNVSAIVILFIVVIFLPGLLIDTLTKIFSFNEFVEKQLKFYTKLEINVNGIVKGLFDIIPILILMFLQRRLREEQKYFIPAVNIYFILVLFSISLAGVARLSNYFAILFIISYINTFVLISRNNSLRKYRLTHAIPIVCFLLIGQYFYFARDASKYNYGNEAYFYHRYYPYNTIFDPVIEIKRENIYRKFMKDEAEK